ncbi:major facilitator superfamily domain-containing protein 4A-like [Panonychus citri]|uniref:major facilitator superfamily domain-containing protein 4A-like n=1 Tax=Panonychus citri TaxID=50023 RepID=UPI00230759D5|nr:major facilitator superfamily domain-containing protein 4A-like [Panonychus citri]
MKASRFIHDNRYKIFKTLLAYLTYFCIGGAITLVGSSLLDLQIRVNTDFATVSYAIPVRSAGHIVGSAVAGLLGQRFSQSFVLCFCNLLSGIFIGIGPFFTQFTYLGTCLFLAGIIHGISDIACNSLLASTWKENCANWLQVLHMSWGVGSLITPVICRPFLLPTTGDETGIVHLSNLTLNGSLIDPVVKPIYTSDDVMVQYAFLIISICALTLSIPFGCIYFKEKSASINTVDHTKTINPDNIQQNYSPLKTYSAVAMVALISHLVYAIETLIGSLGPSFAVKSDLHMDKKTGVLLTTVFWSCFSFYRLIFIPLTFVISQTKLLISSLIISLVGILITVPWANYYTSCIWAGFTLIGIGISPIFSAAYGMLAKHIIVTSKISSIVFIPGVLGESIHPAIAATLLDKNPISCLYYIGVLGILFVSIYLILLVYCARVFKVPASLQHREVAERSSIRSISRY